MQQLPESVLYKSLMTLKIQEFTVEQFPESRLVFLTQKFTQKKQRSLPKQMPKWPKLRTILIKVLLQWKKKGVLAKKFGSKFQKTWLIKPGIFLKKQTQSVLLLMPSSNVLQETKLNSCRPCAV